MYDVARLFVARSSVAAATRRASPWCALFCVACSVGAAPPANPDPIARPSEVADETSSDASTGVGQSDHDAEWAALAVPEAPMPDMIRVDGGRLHGRPIKAFELDRTEVTVDDYRACVAAGVCSVPDWGAPFDNWRRADRLDHPVNQVTWQMAADFCDWRRARLPTDVEWEWAAQNGDAARTYPWGEQSPSCDYAVMSLPQRPAEGSAYGCGRGHTSPVGSRSPQGDTENGIADLAGNLWEWSDGWFDVDEQVRTIAGGSWANSNTEYFRASFRDGNDPRLANHLIGFRCARSG